MNWEARNTLQFLETNNEFQKSSTSSFLENEGITY